MRNLTAELSRVAIIMERCASEEDTEGFSGFLHSVTRLWSNVVMVHFVGDVFTVCSCQYAYVQINIMKGDLNYSCKVWK